MRRTLSFSLAILIVLSASVSRANELAGLWKASRWFGPRVRGTLAIERSGKTWLTDIAGRVVRVPVADQTLSFELPDGEGRFRGKLQPGGEIAGTWVPPRALGMADTYASPVRLAPDGPNRWSGQVVPFEDTFTFYLLLQERPDGSFRALLRNVDRDIGAQFGVERLTREGNAVKLIGKRRGQTEEREVASGTYDRESDVITLAFPNRGGSYDFRREGDQSDFHPRGRKPGRYVYRSPLQRDDGWPIGSLDDAGIDRAAIEAFIRTIVEMPMDALDAPQVHAVLVSRHGKLVLEEYFHGEHRDKLHETRSGAKSVTATLLGAAMQAGVRLALSTPVYEVMNGGTFPPDLEPRKRAMTLEHLLTMSSGYFCDDNDPEAPGNEDRVSEQTEDPDLYRYTLRLPMAMAPGEKAIYCSINPNLALGVLGRATGESPMLIFDRLIGVPMKIRRYGWPVDAAGNPYGGGGVKLLPRDFMKFGQLMLAGGLWQGRRILGRDFVARASSPRVRIGTRDYGYLWWVEDLPYRGRTVRTFSALGAGGQVATVVPELDMVIAGFNGSYFSNGWRWFSGEAIPKLILPAVAE
jgi:CubicO group peptidase (beta-lactamase class C family)